MVCADAGSAWAVATEDDAERVTGRVGEGPEARLAFSWNTGGFQGKDAYHALKGAIRRRSGTGADVEVVLTRVESKPEVWTEPLKDVLAEVGADRDAEIVRAAQTLMSLIDPQQGGGRQVPGSDHGKRTGARSGRPSARRDDLPGRN
jgi:hypothetical protein